MAEDRRDGGPSDSQAEAALTWRTFRKGLGAGLAERSRVHTFNHISRPGAERQTPAPFVVENGNPALQET